MIDYLFAKVAGLLALLAGFFGIFWWGRHQANKRREAEARARVAERIAETVQEQEKRHEAVKEMSDSDLVDYLRRDRR